MRQICTKIIQSSLAITLAGLVLIFASSLSYAQCGAICLYEMGGMEMGRSGAGAGAAAQDASTAFWNSAGMTRLDENQLSVGGWFGVINQKLSLNDSTVSVPPGDTNGGEMAGGFVTPPGIGAASVPNFGFGVLLWHCVHRAFPAFTGFKLCGL